MFDPFGKNDKGDPMDGDVVVLSAPEPQMCGGTYATQHTQAPTEIQSKQMVYFDVASEQGGMVCLSPDGAMQTPRFGFVGAFAVPAGSGSFVFLQTRPVYQHDEPDSVSFALVKEDVFPALDRLVRAHDLAKSNGRHSTTYGLPQNFGGHAEIEYASGETISFSNNQSPILSFAAANEIADFFTAALGGEKQPLPAVGSLRAIRFEERQQDGGFTKAVLTLNPDGTGTNRKEMCFDPGQVYESEKSVDAATVEAIKNNVARCGMFAWAALPPARYSIGEEKTMTFVLADGAEITVTNQKALPMTLSGGFFNIELELVTKH